MKAYKKIIIGIDQAYAATGIAIAADGKLIKTTSTNFKKKRCNTEKRQEISQTLHKIIKANIDKTEEMIILCERIRTFSGGKFGLKPNYLKAVGALIATIVDTAYTYKIPVYSVDTRAWKAQIVGTSKNRDSKNKKLETIEFVENLGFPMYIRTDKNGNDIFDDNAADAACIALYGFIDENKQNLKEEK